MWGHVVQNVPKLIIFVEGPQNPESTEHLWKVIPGKCLHTAQLQLGGYWQGNEDATLWLFYLFLCKRIFFIHLNCISLD